MTDAFHEEKSVAMKIQSAKDLITQMRAVARGEIPAPADAAETSVESVEALVRLLTPENRSLLQTIRDRKPQSIAELAEMTQRAPSNLSRTLSKLEAYGLLSMVNVDNRRVPTVRIEGFHVEINPFAMTDRIEARLVA